MHPSWVMGVKHVPTKRIPTAKQGHWNLSPWQCLHQTIETDVTELELAFTERFGWLKLEPLWAAFCFTDVQKQGINSKTKPLSKHLGQGTIHIVISYHIISYHISNHIYIYKYWLNRKKNSSPIQKSSLLRYYISSKQSLGCHLTTTTKEV